MHCKMERDKKEGFHFPIRSLSLDLFLSLSGNRGINRQRALLMPTLTLAGVGVIGENVRDIFVRNSKCPLISSLN